MRQTLTVISFLFIWMFVTLPACTPPAPSHQSKDRYSTGVTDEEDENKDNEQVRVGMPDAFGEVEEEQVATEDAGSEDTNCTPFNPDYPNC